MCSTVWEGALRTLRSNKKIGLKLALFGIQLRLHTTFFLNSCTHLRMADDMNNNDFGSTFHYSHAIRD